MQINCKNHYKIKRMKKIIVTMCVALFSMGAQAQDCKNDKY